MWAETLFQNKTMVFAASALGLLVAAVLILLIFRLIFGRRLRMASNARTRMPRLGIVDAFDLDRNRQLVIVRRDNVEHLLMIGGPNDLVIEAEIIRVEGRDVRLREKEPREKEPREAIQAGVNWPPEAEPARMPARPVAPERKPAPVAADLVAEPAPPLVPEEPSPPPAPQRPTFPLPPRRTPTFTPYAQRPQRDSVSRSDLSQKGEPGSGSSAPPPPRAPLATPFLRPPPRVAQDTAKQPPASGAAASDASPRSGDLPVETGAPHGMAESSAALEPPPAADTPPPAVAASSFPESLDGPSFAEIFKSSPDPFKSPAGSNPVDTLEQEMAKLLGRGPSK
ncbi:flagellar biosynthetic protein FliO [Methylocapsa palsarum]|uniref:Flagellar biosynthesis protein, FliO n=1 Tax=Methylocapsa palsarum TaxID=1612308 RepID=A0A1I4C738_9HYPH|nr:flagellar biosynthetic protein FliO [Methylocapsa palsarum]SFK75911.1 Flagellar biosynthesis protein, FliO [Methylocapsa palsarum]